MVQSLSMVMNMEDGTFDSFGFAVFDEMSSSWGRSFFQNQCQK